MKNLYSTYLKPSTILLLTLLLQGCSDYLDINTNPDSPSDSQVTEEVLLPGILSGFSYELVGGYFARTSSLWTAQVAVTGESRGLSTLVLQDTDVNNSWEFSLYTSVLKNAKLLEQKAEVNENLGYAGLAKVIQAYALSITADFWNAAPWSQAFDPSIGKPSFDSQEDLYLAIDTLLEDGITELVGAMESSETIEGDILYGGDLLKWREMAYALRARYAMRLVYAKGQGQADLAIGYVEKSFSSNDRNASFVFEDKESANNPWVQWEDKWTDVFINKFMVELMESNQDPRLSAYALQQTDGNIVGGENGTVIQLNGTSQVSIRTAVGALNANTYFVENDSSVNWFSFDELMFIAAEGYLFKGDYGNAELFMKRGVRANLEKIASQGVLTFDDSDIDNYLNSIIFPTTFEAGQKMIIEQKYIAGFLQIEPYNDYRRTGYPEVPLPVTAFNNQIPERFPYPTNPILNNTENVPDVNYVTDKVWWNQK